MMKKRILVLILSLLTALGISACGKEDAAGKGSDRDSKSESDIVSGSGQDLQNNSFVDDNNIIGQNSSDPDSPLADWYNGGDRTVLEDTINNLFNDSGLSFFVTIEEPDIIIYNYQYTEQLDFSAYSQENVQAGIEKNLKSSAETLINDIKTYRTAYGIPLSTIRMNYLNADGTLIYSLDITEDFDTSKLSDTEGAYANLQEWIDSEEAATTVETVNQTIASTGLTFDLAADGNVLIYQYYLPNDQFADLTEEQLNTFFDSMVDSNSSTVGSVVDMFANEYGITVDAMRFTFSYEDGTELYRKDVDAVQ